MSNSKKLSNAEVLEAVIKKAIGAGWKGNHFINTNSDWELHDDGMMSNWGEPSYMQCIIYNHEFAKSLWGEEWKTTELEEYIPKTNTYRVGTIESCWQWHLKNMVISPDPINYLKEHAL